MSVSYPAVTVEGGLLSGGLVQRIGDGDPDLPGADPASYGLQSGESIRQYANRSFAYLKDVWREFARHHAKAGNGGLARLTRERWLLVLLRELGYANLGPLPGGLTIEDRPFPVSHQWESVPAHLLGWGVDLDKRTSGMKGAAQAAPQAMVQQLLNRSDQHLWAVLSNGQRLRLLRDSTSLVGSAYVEFDLEAIFDDDLFPDFLVLYRTAHASRLAVRDPETGPSSCWMEAWRAYGAEQGERALHQLRAGVEKALAVLGTGFLNHPSNPHLRTAIDRELSLEDYQRSLLRLVYRLLFWFVTEDREVLLAPGSDPAAVARYDRFFSARRLRDLAVRRRHSNHSDLWESVRLVFDVLGVEGGYPKLALPGIGGLFEDGALDEPLDNARLTNTALLRAVEALAVLPARRGGQGRQRVDFRHLGTEELGSVYESLLELRPRWDPANREFSLERLAGNERKTSGSYYTPPSLVECLLDSALDPLLDEASALPTREQRIAALLDLTVCDPACGSGHFLIAAARRIAKRLAVEETDELEPPPAAVRSAMRRVIAQCIYGVDVNEMSVELAKVSLWVEAIEPGRPLGYLDANIRVGNSLLGVTPKLLADGIPDAAFAALEGDDKKVTASLRKQNTKEQAGQGDLFGSHKIPVSNAKLAEDVEAIVHTDPRSLADVHVQQKRAAAMHDSPEWQRAKLAADAWCAAFVQPKTEQSRLTAITQATLERLAEGEGNLDAAATEELVDKLTRQYRFFHWHIEFPHIFRVPEMGGGDPATGWVGGFSCVIGNPPWERVKLQEKEFFASRAPEIAEAKNAAVRKKLIAALAESDESAERELFRAFTAELRRADGESHLLRSSGRYPLTGRGDINTYAVFAETACVVLNDQGRLGMILPTGIATDATTQEFFRHVVERRRLASVLDFVTNPLLWTDVGHRRFRFVILVCVGQGRSVDVTEFAALTKHPSHLPPLGSRVSLPTTEILKVNPNTGTCPLFSSRRDADIVVSIYRRVPVLWRDGDSVGNPWGISFLSMFHMSNDSASFVTADVLVSNGWSLRGNVFEGGAGGVGRMLPLYEAKLAHHYDHRLACYSKRPEGSQDTELPRLTEDEKLDPRRVPIPRYWVTAEAVEQRLGPRWQHGWFLGWRDICRSTDERTLIATVVPRYGVGGMYLAFPRVISAGLVANFGALILDYVSRQKIAGTHMSLFVQKQLPVLPPNVYANAVAWGAAGGQLLDSWIAARVLELSYTAYDLEAYAKDLGDDGPPFRWIPERRELMRAELDAAYFHLYGVERDDVDYIMDTFKVVRQKDEATHGEYRTKRLILERYDAMVSAVRTGVPYQTPLDPAPGQGPRHSWPESRESGGSQ